MGKQWILLPISSVFCPEIATHVMHGIWVCYISPVYSIWHIIWFYKISYCTLGGFRTLDDVVYSVTDWWLWRFCNKSYVIYLIKPTLGWSPQCLIYLFSETLRAIRSIYHSAFPAIYSRRCGDLPSRLAELGTYVCINFYCNMRDQGPVEQLSNTWLFLKDHWMVGDMCT